MEQNTQQLTCDQDLNESLTEADVEIAFEAIETKCLVSTSIAHSTCTVFIFMRNMQGGKGRSNDFGRSKQL